MLQTLNIKNFALIADECIEFSKGFNVLVGETGAGKSLILDALGFVLGDKANKLNIRSGEQKLFVQAVFSVDNVEVVNFLKDNDIDCDDQIIFSRSLTIDGKSECRVNGVIIPVGILKNITVMLIDFYRQNENIDLLNAKRHLHILDTFAGGFDGEKQIISSYLTELATLNEQMSGLGGNREGRERELELLEYQIKDIENANLTLGEDEVLKQELERYSNFEKIYDNINQAIISLQSTNVDLQGGLQCLNSALKYDESLAEITGRTNSCGLELADILDTLKEYLSNFDYDEKKLEDLDSRLELIKSLKKKYGNSLEQIFEYLIKIKEDYDNILFGEEKLAKLNLQKEKIEKTLYSICQELSLKRREVATKIENLVVGELKMLGFKNASFKVYFQDIPNINDSNFDKNGLDKVEFLLSANAGEQLKSLNKTISGGEMSRFMLALKNVFAKCFNTSVLVFDEIDTGISGEIGQKVAERLARLSTNNQLICITHLCQVAAMADEYIFVQKNVREGKTYTTIRHLDEADSIKYLAISSGAEPTSVALEFAKELKSKAKNYKERLNI